MSYQNHYIAQARLEVREGFAGGHRRRRALRRLSVALRLVEDAHDPAEFERRHYEYWTRLVADAEKHRLLLAAKPGDHPGGTPRSTSYREVIAPAQHLDPAAKALYFEAKTFLHGLLVVEDHVSMANSLEARVPFLDNDLSSSHRGSPRASSTTRTAPASACCARR